jgi:hypothetical protein
MIVSPSPPIPFQFTQTNSPLPLAKLPGNFVVWLASPEAKFLKGKYTWVNWDVDELKTRAEEIKNSNMLTLTLEGWPFGTDGSFSL